MSKRRVILGCRIKINYATNLKGFNGEVIPTTFESQKDSVYYITQENDIVGMLMDLKKDFYTLMPPKESYVLESTLEDTNTMHNIGAEIAQFANQSISTQYKRVWSQNIRYGISSINLILQLKLMEG